MFDNLDLRDFKEFRTSEKEIKEDFLDPEYQNWRDEEATQGQIRYVYVLAKQMGLSGKEAEATWDFHHMTKGEIKDLIDELQESLGIEPQDNHKKKQSWKDKVKDEYSFDFSSIDDDDLPF